MQNMIDALKILRPDVHLHFEEALGCYTLGADGAITSWQADGEPPTEDEMRDALARVKRREQLSELQIGLSQLYALFVRADARGDEETKAEIRDEVGMVLNEIKELEDDE